ncbi:MAG: hypothetical protein A2V88_08260 [Elusimicrobia bacterium RBG_16_66_12]|nr:MAG: hypothetical protein A2V88_08260 [Elusimicrobia bacterium RBG_16_66_12]
MARARRRGLENEAAELLRAYLADPDHGHVYRDFHWGRSPDRERVIEVEPLPARAWQLGELVAVVYETDKGGELAHWHHDFRRARPVLAATEQGSLLVLGGSYRVTPRGIVG